MTTEFPKSDGHVFYADEANKIVNSVKQVYTGTGFNSAKSGTAGSDTQDHELDAITSTSLQGYDYVVIEITGFSGVCSAQSSGSAAVEVKIQAKETGGVYVDSMAYKTTLCVSSFSPGAFPTSVTSTLTYYHTLTAGEKANGVQFTVFSRSTTTGPGSDNSSSFTNINTTVKLP